jgi:histidyl-tRNA synthetase
MVLIKSIKGMNDIFEENLLYYEFIEKTAKKIFDIYGYSGIRTPFIESENLYLRGIGEYTDIIEKEMYTFNDKNGKKLALRPEGTAGIVRAFLESNAFKRRKNNKYYYIGAMFRRENTQRGRFRQFHQIGAESFGADSYISDIEIIDLLSVFLRELGLKKFRFHVNFLGNKKEKNNFTKILYNYYIKIKEELCLNCLNRLNNNVLRLLDCKEKKCMNLKNYSPKIKNYININSRKYFNKIISKLQDLEIPYKLDINLIRGIDYYTKTIFEVYPDKNSSSRNAIAAGGRYDELIHELSDKKIPAIGFATGIERLIILLQEIKKIKNQKHPKLFLVFVDETGFKKSLKLLFELRKIKISTYMEFDKKTTKQQLRKANKINAEFVIMIGKNEIINKTCKIKNFKTKQIKTCKLSSIHIKKNL